MNTLPGHSRVWIYAADRPLGEGETRQIREAADAFVRGWSAHGHSLAAAADVLFDRFLVLAVDERQAGATGCSIDSSVQLVRELGAAFGIDFFDRLSLQWPAPDGSIRSASQSEFREMLASGNLKGDSIVFNHMVADLDALRRDWMIPMQQSWHGRVFKSAMTAG